MKNGIITSRQTPLQPTVRVFYVSEAIPFAVCEAVGDAASGEQMWLAIGGGQNLDEAKQNALKFVEALRGAVTEAKL